MSASISHHRLAELIGGELVHGEPDGLVTGLNSIAEAEPGEVTFLGNAKYQTALKTSRATAVLVSRDFAEFADGKAYIAVENPTLAFSAVIRHFGPPPKAFTGGQHSTAQVAASAVFDSSRVSIGPNVVIEDDVVIGDGTVIHAGVYLGHGARIGSGCELHANCSVRERCTLGDRVVVHCNAVIGADGFGFQLTEGRHRKIEQVGVVQVDDDVEIGACSTIDRARFGRTWIGEGTKIDNLVQIAHNVVVGKHCLLCAQVGISGSTQLGNFVTLAGQVGVVGHIKIVDGVVVLAQAGVVNDLLEAGTYMGYPARPVAGARRSVVLTAKLPELLERIKRLEKLVGGGDPGSD
ncbi:MAG TPA: UDP-3-O-(3-hydroxymyristoyl)glucosamine N-acyltransferase [Prosthecobacter sp.]|nr:UDP-3-O-(3-hydroxymyristoyl)glucosamine N-acyltransferase [Prosthecobacter sp.]